MAELIDQYRFDCPLPDGFWFIKALEFMSRNIADIIPLSFSWTTLSVNMIAKQDKKKNQDGHEIRGYLVYDRTALRKYRLLQDKNGGEAAITDPATTLIFGVDGAVLHETFKKNNLKAISQLHIYSKIGGDNLYYRLDSGDTQYTLKT